MLSIQALRERHSALAKDTRELVEKNNENWNNDLQDKYDQSLAEMDDIKAQINRAERVLQANADERIEDKMRESNERKVHAAGTELFAKWLKGGDKALSAQDWADIRATMSTTTGSEGGYTVPTGVSGQVLDVLKAFGGMREVSTVITTESGNDISFPTSDGTSETGELVAQNTTATPADPTFGTVALSVHKFSSKVVAIPYELLQDSAIDIIGFVSRRLGDRLGRVTNTYFTNGTGTAQPKGALTAAAAGKVGTTGQTLTVIYDDLVDLVHSVDPAYRNKGCRFMMNDSSLKVARKLKDTQGRPIFLPGYDGLAGPMADSLLGYDIAINQDVPVMAANAKSIMFGDFSRYTIRDVMGMTLFRFDDSAYAKLGQVGFLAWMRSGGTLTDGGAPIRYYQNSAT